MIWPQFKIYRHSGYEQDMIDVKGVIVRDEGQGWVSVDDLILSSRLFELARRKAQENHAAAIAKPPSQMDGHTNTFAEDFGFSTCPHSDCALVRHDVL